MDAMTNDSRLDAMIAADEVAQHEPLCRDCEVDEPHVCPYIDAVERCGSLNRDPAYPHRCIRHRAHDGNHGYAGVFWEAASAPRSSCDHEEQAL